MSASENDASFLSRFMEFSALFERATQYADDRTLLALKDALRQLDEKYRGEKLSLYCRKIREEIDATLALKTELGRARRLKKNASYYATRLHEWHRQDEETKKA